MQRRTRLAFAALLSSVLVALSLGAFARNAGATDDHSDTRGDGSAGHSTLAVTSDPVPAANSPLPDKCGLHIVLVVDRSGSTEQFDSTYRAATAAFVNGLGGTPSHVGIVRFDTLAAVASPYVDISSIAKADALANNITGGSLLLGPVGNLTNWQDALTVTRDNFGGSVDNPMPDLVVFITDGKPTTKTSGPYADLGAGVEAANLLKASGGPSPRPHITGVAVGDFGTDGLANIGAITGSDNPAGSGVGGADPDVHQSDTSTLIDDMKALATELCGGTVTLHKTVQTGPDTFVPADGWEFTSSTAGPVAVTTDSAGVANLKFADAGTKAITESGLAGYVMQRVDCGDARLSHVGPAGFSVDVSHSAIINCAVVNAPVLGSITVQKVTTHGVGGPFDFEVSGQNAVRTHLSATTDAENLRTPVGAVSGLFPGDYTIDETSMPPGWALTTVDCGDATIAKPGSGALSPRVEVEVHPGEKVACTFTDDELPSDLSIVKKASGPIAVNAGADQQIDYTLTIDNHGPADAHDPATVTDMVPAVASLLSITTPTGVSCGPSVASEVTCTVPTEQLEAADPPVVISIRVTVPTGSGAVRNQSMVSSPDDPAPCTVTSNVITCNPTDTNNFSEVSSDVPTLPAPSPPAASSPSAPAPGPPAGQAETPVQVEAQVASLAFTGSGSVRLLALGTALVIVGAFVLVLRRRRRSNP